MKLTNRLNQVASFVNKGATLVDVGCDHGFLVVYLLKTNKINKAYACDINQGPLDNVKDNVKIYGFENVIECILSNGLEKLSNIEFDTVVIAGMGGSLIVDILEQNKSLIIDKQLVLQPNINSYGLRKWLLSNDFMIENEAIIEDNNIIYEVLNVLPAKEKHVYNNLELQYGKINLENKTDLLITKMKSDLMKYQEIIKKMPVNNKYHEFILKIQIIEEYLNEIKKSY